MRPSLWPGYYDVVILPPAAVRDYAIELSRELRRFGGHWALGRRHFLPHISLYHIPVVDDRFEDFARELQRIADSVTWGYLQTTGFDMPLLMTDKPDWLKALHRKVVQRTVQYFDWNSEVWKTWSLHRFSGRRLEFARRYLRKYGTPMAGMNFRPHMTLTSFGDSALPEVDLSFRKMRFRADRLAICELGESHSCQRIIATD